MLNLPNLPNHWQGYQFPCCVQGQYVSWFKNIAWPISPTELDTRAILTYQQELTWNIGDIKIRFNRILNLKYCCLIFWTQHIAVLPTGIYNLSSLHYKSFISYSNLTGLISSTRTRRSLMSTVQPYHHQNITLKQVAFIDLHKFPFLAEL